MPGSHIATHIADKPCDVRNYVRIIHLSIFRMNTVETQCALGRAVDTMALWNAVSAKSKGSPPVKNRFPNRSRSYSIFCQKTNRSRRYTIFGKKSISKSISYSIFGGKSFSKSIFHSIFCSNRFS